MKKNFTQMVGTYLAAIVTSAAFAGTHVAGAQTIYERTLPAARVTAEWKRPAPIREVALCKGCSLNAVIIGGASGGERELCPDCGLCSDCAALPQAEEKHFNMLLKTNALYDLALLPNLGLEIGLGKGWSIGGSAAYGWWTDKNRFYWRAFAADIGVRKYFGGGRNGAGGSLAGHHVGLYAGIMTYDFELGGRGYICDWHEEWGRYYGIEYGWTLPLAKNFNLDFTLGLGYAGGRFKEYLPAPAGISEGWHYIWQSTGKLHYFGPTRLEISLVWNIEL